MKDEPKGGVILKNCIFFAGDELNMPMRIYPAQFHKENW